MSNTAIKSAHRQMSAVIAKAMENVEGMEFLHELHPLEFDKLRKKIIAVAWDAYNVGLWLGKREDDDIHRPEYRTEHS